MADLVSTLLDVENAAAACATPLFAPLRQLRQRRRALLARASAAAAPHVQRQQEIASGSGASPAPKEIAAGLPPAHAVPTSAKADKAAAEALTANLLPAALVAAVAQQFEDELITDRDGEALQSLSGITHAVAPAPADAATWTETLTLHFAANDFFTNAELTLDATVTSAPASAAPVAADGADEANRAGEKTPGAGGAPVGPALLGGAPVVVRVVPRTPPDWKPGRALTSRARKTPRGGAAAEKPRRCPSFFHLFTPRVDELDLLPCDSGDAFVLIRDACRLHPGMVLSGERRVANPAAGGDGGDV